MGKLSIKNYFSETHLFTRRVFFALFFVLVLVAILVGRLFYLQVTEHKLYTTLSEQNQLNLIPIDPNRGLIYDRNGVLLAENVPVFSLDVIPNHVPNFKTSLAELRKIIPITDEDVQQYHRALKQRHSSEGVPLKLNLNEAEVASFYLNQFRFPGFGITGRLMRNYPLGDTMVSALGYVTRINEEELSQVDSTNYAASDYIGKLGIEKFYEPELHGKVGYQQVETDANGQVIRTLKRIPPVSGNSLYVTLDSGLQAAAEKALGTDKGAVVAIDPANGEVLAFVSNPRYDPNPFVRGISSPDYKKLQQDPARPLYNRALRGLYPPGSTIKPFYAVAGLEDKIVTPDYKIHDNGFFYLPGVSHVFKDWNWRQHGHGIVDIHKAIVQSCDVYFFTLAQRMGIDRMHTMITRFGLGKPTGLDVKEELGGVAPSPQWKRSALGQAWYLGDTVNAGIGQGYTLVTPLQMAAAVTAIANRGLRYQPHFLYKWQKPDGTFITPEPTIKTPVVLKDPSIWDTVIDAMRDVVAQPGGTAHRLSEAAYPIAGKTGTAQVFRPESYGDKDSDAIPQKYRSHAWFIAFAPVQNPKIALAVLVENHPHQGPVVAKQVLDYYLLPNHGQTTKPPATPDSATPTEDDADTTTESELSATGD